MSPGVNKYISRRNRKIVREILMHDWDPIGVRDFEGAEDEYDTYVGEVYVLLMDEESEETIAAYLWGVVTGHIGSEPTSNLAERTARTAGKLVSLCDHPLERIDLADAFCVRSRAVRKSGKDWCVALLLTRFLHGAATSSSKGIPNWRFSYMWSAR
jgi:hypothetical protein